MTTNYASTTKPCDIHQCRNCLAVWVNKCKHIQRKQIKVPLEFELADIFTTGNESILEEKINEIIRYLKELTKSK